MGKVAADGATQEIFANESILEENHLEKPLSMNAYAPYHSS
jgi:hypothetical protein